MALYHVLALDKPNALALRMATRAAHLAYVRGLGAAMKLGAPLLAEDGQTMIGSVFVFEAASRTALQAILDADPYAQAGLFAQVDVRLYGGRFDP